MLKTIWTNIVGFWESYTEARAAYIRAKYRYELGQTLPEYLQYDIGLKSNAPQK